MPQPVERRISMAAAFVLIVAACGGDDAGSAEPSRQQATTVTTEAAAATTTTTAAPTTSTTTTLEPTTTTLPAPIRLAADFWQAVADGDGDRAAGLASGSAADLARLLSVFGWGDQVHSCQSGAEADPVEVICTLGLDHPLFAHVNHADIERRGAGPVATTIISDEEITSLEPPDEVSDAIGTLYSWLLETSPETTREACPSDPTTAATHQPGCGNYLVDAIDEYFLDLGRRFLEAVAAGDQSMVQQMIEVPDWEPHTTQQLRNAYGYLTAFQWGGEVGDCELGWENEPGHQLRLVTCQVRLDHPLLGTGEWDWMPIAIEAGAIEAGAPPGPEAYTSDDDDLYRWALEAHPETTEEVCGKAHYESSELLQHHSPMALHPDCGAHLAGLVDEYLAELSGG